MGHSFPCSECGAYVFAKSTTCYWCRNPVDTLEREEKVEAGIGKERTKTKKEKADIFEEERLRMKKKGRRRK